MNKTFYVERIICPSCRIYLEINRSLHMGQLEECTNCGKRFRVLNTEKGWRFIYFIDKDLKIKIRINEEDFKNVGLNDITDMMNEMKNEIEIV